MEDRRRDPLRELRLAELEASIARRLEHVCQNMPRDEFARMVERIAVIDIKYRLRRDILFPQAPD